MSEAVAKKMICREDVGAALDTDFVGRELHLFDELVSTNITARELAMEGASEGTAVVAERQSGGRGRNGRLWYSPAGRNIYTSVILRPPIETALAPQLTLVAAVAMAETVSGFLKDSPRIETTIKWPNDILAGGKKCAGILTEMKGRGPDIDFVIVGAGVNVNMRRSDLPRDISSVATSILIESGKVQSREAVLQTLYSNMENWYKRYLEGGFAPVRDEWNRLSGINGRRVRAASAADGMYGYEEGVALGVDGEGALLLRKDDGTMTKVVAGDVTLSGV